MWLVGDQLNMVSIFSIFQDRREVVNLPMGPSKYNDMKNSMKPVNMANESYGAWDKYL